MFNFDEYQIVIPMAGHSARFYDAGYSVPKPLIKFCGSTMIGHILSAFTDFPNILLIASEEHINDVKLNLKESILKIRPDIKIATIPPHRKGPSYSIKLAEKFINLEKKTIVHYTDFLSIFNLSDFLAELENSDGCWVTIKGFHPHKMRSTKFAHVIKDKEGNIIDLKEKEAFNENPEEEESSAGIYGISSGQLMMNSIDEQLARNINAFGEFYTSLAFIPMLEKKLKIRTVLTKKYLCWGTPEDFEDFLYYFNVRKSLIRSESNPSKLNGKVIILAAGSSERFKTSDNFPKQVELIFGRQLWEYSRDLSKSPSECILVTTKSLLEKLSSTKDFKDVISLDEPSSSQAHSARLGLESLQESEYPIHILASDSLINNVSGDKISNLLFDCDLVLWTSRNYPLGAMKPESYSWVTTNDDDVVQAFKYKDEPKSINSWKLITGNFTFKNSTIASQLVSEVIQNFGPYPSLDLVIEIALSKGMAIRTVDVPYFMTVGTQEEGAIIKYWTDLEFGQ